MIPPGSGWVQGRDVRLIDDRYELLEVVASGGMATVWRARDTRLDRPVAVKLPHPGLSGTDDAERMDREARAAAALRHPNLVTVHDYGSDDDGPYLVMELVEGPTLRELSGQIGAAEAVDIGARLADGLAAIHEAGIVHRDVKPGNVIMSAHGPLLTDFGIALDRNLTGELTDPGQVLATPSYAAPEVLRGDRPTPASDVYSLAVVVEELIGEAEAEPDSQVRQALDSALADSPDDRPDAAGFAGSLRGGAPTVSSPPSDDSTLILAPAHAGVQEHDRGRTKRLGPWGIGVVALLGLGLVAAALALAANDPEANATAEPSTIPSTMAAQTTIPATTSTTTTDTTVADQDEVSETRDRLEAILLEPPRSDLNPKDVEDIMKKVDEAIVRAEDGDSEEAGKKLSEGAKRIEEKIDGDRAEEALAELDRLADLLDVEEYREGEDGDD